MLLKSGLLLVTFSFCSPYYCKTLNSAFNVCFLRMSNNKLYGLLHCLLIRKFECSLHSKARVSIFLFRVHVFLWYFNPVLVINITGLLVFHNFFCMSNNFGKVLPTTPVWMTEHCQHFEMFLDNTGFGPPVSGVEAHKIWGLTETRSG